MVIDTKESSGFEHWAIVQIFGKVTYAGKVSTQNIAGVELIKCEVPEVTNMEVTFPAFVKFWNTSSIYEITPVEEEYAREMAKRLSKHPVEGYQHREVIEALAKKHATKMTVEELTKLINKEQKELSEPTSGLEF